MKRFARSVLAFNLILASLATIYIDHAHAVTTTCSGATCTADFSYTGAEQTWTVPFSGNFIIETWGAQGGDVTTTYPLVGGKGGYTKGTSALTGGATIYIYVGGKGANIVGDNGSLSCALTAGPFGGGGGSYNNGGNGSPGGGASDVRVGGNALANRIIVAGGGGGVGWTYAAGGVGGGLSGGNGTNANGSGTGAYGGTQSAGGAVGSAGAGCTRTAGSLGQGGFGSGWSAGGGGGGGGYYGGGGGGYNDGGGGGSSYYGTLTNASTIAGNATMPDPAGGTTTGRSGAGYVRITYDNVPVATSFTSSQSTPTNTSTSISYSLTLSQSSTGVANADFANAGTATGCVFSISASSGTTFTLTVSSCSEGTLIPKLLANSVYGTVTATNGPNADSNSTSTIIIDRTSPTISSVAAPSNKTYVPADTPTFTFVFSESVTVTGTPRIALTVGSLAKYANFVSMSDSKTALFRYTVATATGEFDTDGIAIASTTLDLNGGAIADLAANALSPAAFTAPTLTSVLVAQPASAPTITSITATSTQLDINFTAGASNGSAITNYQYSLNSGAWTNRATGTTASPLTITGLTNGTAYAVRIRAISAAGNGDSSTAVTETPTAISVTGDTTLVITYGGSGSTGAYSATGGTGSYTWTLGSVLTGVTLSGTTVTAGATTPAGTYTQTVRATDGNSQVGTKTLTITVNKATTSITIALPNSASNAALGGAITITATVPRAGAVNFKLGGSTISGCGSASAASTTATCSWTPGSLGSVALTAIFTPTDSSNFETSTTTTLNITVVNGVSSVTLSLTGGVTQVQKGQTINIIAAIDQAGKVTFLIDGKRIPGCISKSGTVGNVTCSWKPSVQKMVTISATLTPTNSVYNASTSKLPVWVVRRSGTR